MNRILIWIAAGTMLSMTACTATRSSTGTVTLAPAPIVTQTEQFTVNDLQTSIQIAAAAGPAGAPIVACNKQLLSLVQSAQAQANTPQPVAGVATAFTEAYLGLNAVNNATSAASVAPLADACGPLVMRVRLAALDAAGRAAAIAAMFGVVVPK